MPLHHHGGAPHTKRQQRTKTDADGAVFEESAGIEREIHTEPFNHRRWEQTVNTHTSTRGGTLSATDDAAAQIRALASSENVPTAVLSQAYTSLGTFMGEIQAATGETSQHRQDLLGSVQQAQSAVQTAIDACTKLLDDIHKAADGHARG